MKHFWVPLVGMLIVASMQVLAGTEVDPNTPNTSIDLARIQQELESRYPVAKVSADGANIVMPGVVLVLQKDNLVMNKVYMTGTQRSSPVQNVYANNQIAQVGFMAALSKVNSFLSVLGNIDAQSRSFVRADKVSATSMTVQADGILVQLISDPIKNARYHGTLKFPFDNILTTEQAIGLVGEVLGTDLPTDAGANVQRTLNSDPSATIPGGNAIAQRDADSAQAQPSADQVLDSCMRSSMAQGALVGGVVGGILGRLLGGNNNTGQHTAIGAALGGALGGAIAWQSSFQSCSRKLNLATVGSLQTDNYKNTAQRYSYDGNGVVLTIEEGNVPSAINAGQTLSADLKYALLTPDANDTDVQVARTFTCGNTQIPVTTERYTVTPGTIVSTGKIQIPSLSNGIGQQSCTMWMGVAAAGLKDEWQGNFVIIPNQQ